MEATRDLRRAQIRARLAVLFACTVSMLASVITPPLVWFALDGQSVDARGWSAVLAMLLPMFGFPFTHLAAHAVLVGGAPHWLSNRSRLGELVLFTTWTCLLLVLVLGKVLDPGIGSLVWPAGMLLGFFVRRR